MLLKWCPRLPWSPQGDISYCLQLHSSYYYYSSNNFVRTVSQEWLNRSWWNFIALMRVPWRVAGNVDMFQYGCRCHGNDKNIQNSLISIFSETVRPFIIKLHTNVNHHEPLLLHHIPLPKWPPLPWKPHVFEGNEIWIFYFENRWTVWDETLQKR